MKRLIACAVAFAMALTAFFCTAPSAAAFETEDIGNENQMALGYSIINGYSKLSAREGLTSYDRTAVYCGLDVNDPRLIALAGGFYLTNGVDWERTLTDNDYALGLARRLNGFLAAFGVKNERLLSLKEALQKEGVTVTESLDSVGLLFLSADSAFAARLMADDRVDFVFAGGRVPPSMKDLNMDGSSDARDAPLIQQYLAGSLTYPDRDENEYVKFAGDINQDKRFDINDATALMG